VTAGNIIITDFKLCGNFNWIISQSRIVETPYRTFSIKSTFSEDIVVSKDGTQYFFDKAKTKFPAPFPIKFFSLSKISFAPMI